MGDRFETLGVLLRGPQTEFHISTGPKSASDRRSDLHSLGSGNASQRLQVGIHGNQFNACERVVRLTGNCPRNLIHRIAAGSADTKHFKSGPRRRFASFRGIGFTG